MKRIDSDIDKEYKRQFDIRLERAQYERKRRKENFQSLQEAFVLALACMLLCVAYIVPLWPDPKEDLHRFNLKLREHSDVTRR